MKVLGTEESEEIIWILSLFPDWFPWYDILKEWEVCVIILRVMHVFTGHSQTDTKH